MEDALDWPLEIRRGREFSEPFGFVNDDDSAMDLTGYTVKAQVRDRQAIDGNLIIEFTVRIDDPLTGEVYLELTDAETSAITARRGFYDLLLIDAAGKDETYVEGVVAFKGSVTANA